jgi:multiple sugar transport system permease protein
MWEENKMMMHNRANYMKQIRKMPRYVIVIILCAIFLLPFIVMLTTSFKTMEDAFTLPVRILPREFTLDNFPAAFERIPFLKYMGNTAFITIMSLIGQLLVTPMVAYSLAKIKWKGTGIISALLMATMMIPFTVTMIPLYKIWQSVDLIGTYVPLIAPAFFGNSFYIIIMRQFFAGIPNSLMEAAKIDGTNEWQRYYMISLPLCKPALTTIGIYTFLAAWSDYLAPLIYINEKDKLTLSLGLQQFLNEFTVDWTMLMAAATIFVLPVIILFLLFQRNFVEGIATSGLKA